MKKILSTTLAAIALSIAMVSTVDARKVTPRKRANSAPAAADILQVSKEAMDAKKDNAPMAEQKEAGKAVVATITDPNMSPEQQELRDQRIKEADLERDVKLVSNELKDINYGWFGFGTTKEQQDNYRKVKADLNDLNAKLRDVKARIKELERITGKRYSLAMKTAIGVATAMGITLLAYVADQQFGGGEGLKYIQTNRPTMESIRARGSKFQEDYFPERFGGRKPVVAPVPAPEVTESNVIVVD